MPVPPFSITCEFATELSTTATSFLKCASKVAPAPGPGRAPLAAARSSGTRASSDSVLLGTTKTKTSESSCQPGRYHDRDSGGSEARPGPASASLGGSESNLKPPAGPALPRSQAPADPEIPNSRSPDSRFGRESGRESPIPDSAEIGNREIPRFPIWPGIGNRGPDWPQIGKSGIPSV